MSPDDTYIQSDKGTSLWEDAWIKLRKNRLALIGLGLLIFLCIMSLLTPWIAPYGYEAAKPFDGRNTSISATLAGYGYFWSGHAY